MTYTATITQKGQVTLPKQFRDLLKIGFYDTVMISVVEDKQIVIEPTYDVLDLAGSIKPTKNKGVDPVKARSKMEQSYRRP